MASRCGANGGAHGGQCEGANYFMIQAEDGAGAAQVRQWIMQEVHPGEAREQERCMLAKGGEA